MHIVATSIAVVRFTVWEAASRQRWRGIVLGMRWGSSVACHFIEDDEEACSELWGSSMTTRVVRECRVRKCPFGV